MGAAILPALDGYAAPRGPRPKGILTDVQFRKGETYGNLWKRQNTQAGDGSSSLRSRCGHKPDGPSSRGTIRVIGTDGGVLVSGKPARSSITHRRILDLHNRRNWPGYCWKFSHLIHGGRGRYHECFAARARATLRKLEAEGAESLQCGLLWVHIGCCW